MAKTSQDKTDIFENKPVALAVASMTIPTVLSQVITLIYNLADTFFVGHTGDPYQVAALTLAFPLYMVLTGIGNLFGIGANSRISRSLGEGDRKKARQTSAFAIWGGLVVAAVLMLILGIFLKPILTSMGASSETYGFTRDYIVWVMLVGGIPTTASLLFAHCLRGEGRTKEASAGMMIGGILNMLLDPLFIFPLDMGVGGAGLATMISNCVCLLYYCTVIIKNRQNTVITVDPREFTFKGGKEIVLVGFPAAMVIVLGTSSNIILTRSLASYGDIPVASYGVTQKFGTITMNIATGITQGVMPLIGYNYASGNHERVRKVCRCSFVILLAFVAVFLSIYQLFPEGLMRLFIKESNTVELGSKFLVKWSLAVPGMTFVFLFNSIFQAMGMWKRSLLLTVIRQGILFIGAMYALNAIMGMYGLIWAQPVSDAISLVLGFILYLNVAKRLKAGPEKNE